jgi:peptidoglycan/LPS O-acetylase OafA/YrhL
MRNANFPRWAAPFVGTVVGAYFAAKSAVDADGVDWKWIPAGAALGLIAGMLVFVVDRPPKVSDSESSPPGAIARLRPPEFQSTESFVVGRILAMLSVLLIWAPWIGFATAMAAVWVNRRMGWSRTISVAAAAIGFVYTVVATVGVVLYAD